MVSSFTWWPGVEPVLLAAAVVIVDDELVLTVCPNCAIATTLTRLSPRKFTAF